MEHFDFLFDPRFRRVLALIGVRPESASVTLDGDRLRARFGPWSCESPIGNVRDVSTTGPYQWFKVIGPHVSFADRGLTFGTNATRGVCVRFAEPVPGLLPFGVVRHPGLTLTLAEPDRFTVSLEARAASR